MRYEIGTGKDGQTIIVEDELGMVVLGFASKKNDEYDGIKVDQTTASLIASTLREIARAGIARAGTFGDLCMYVDDQCIKMTFTQPFGCKICVSVSGEERSRNLNGPQVFALSVAIDKAVDAIVLGERANSLEKDASEAEMVAERSGNMGAMRL